MVNYAPVEKVSWTDLWEIRGFRLNIIGGILLTLVLSPLMYLATDKTHPYEFLAEGSYILPPQPVGGDQITVMWKVTWSGKDCEGEVRRVIFDPTTKVEFTYVPEPAAGPHTLHDGYLNKTFRLPRNLGAGWWGYRSDLIYACNFLQRWVPALRIRYSTPDLYFKVAE